MKSFLLILLCACLMEHSANAIIMQAEHTGRDGVFYSREAINAMALEKGAMFPSVGMGVGTVF